jgi:glycosyltransferase involved in cell wall biosynthesis
MVLYHPPPEMTAFSTNQWLGCFMPGGDWMLPTARGTLVFVGSHLMLSERMAMRALRSGRLSIICHFNGRYQPLNIYRFLLWPLGERLYRGVSNLPNGSLLRRALFRLAAMPAVEMAWRRVFKRAGVETRMTAGSGLSGEALYAAVCDRAMAQPVAEKISPIPGRVLLVNAGLAAGGAERQIVNTLVGLKHSAACESAILLAEYIEHAPNLDFFLPEAMRQGIEVAQVRRTGVLAYEGLAFLSPAVAEVVADLPSGLLEEILDFVKEFRERRPSVVHAWQDSSSIKAGLAAVIAGVPRIVLASRNVTPTNFGYYQDFMHPAYRALAALDCVKFLNNSAAGCADYIQWLSLPPERFTVVRNGVDLREFKRVSGADVAAYRASLNIPAGARVVGSVFRFWPEKRPMLWLEAAVILAAQCPDVHFLVIGEGIMRAEMEAFVERNGLVGRVHLPGARPEVATPLSSMDLFVLTSEFEGTPNVVLEAQWLGLPVVATDSGGTREAFDIGRSGLLADPPSAPLIAQQALALLSDAQLLADARQAGPEFVSRTFGMARMIRQTLALYGIELAQEGGGGTA